MDINNLSSVPSAVASKLTETVAEIPLSGGWVFAPNWIHAGAIVLLIFLTIFMFGRMRHLYVGWSIKGVLPGVFFGFVLALILEAFFILAGRTVVTELLGWKNPPKPISVALDFGRERIGETLGAASVPKSIAGTSDVLDIVGQVGQLTPDERLELESYVCRPK